MNIWIVIFDHEYGTDHHAYRNYLDAYEAVRDYLETWFEPGDYDGPSADEQDYTEYVQGDTVSIAQTPVQ